MNTDTMKRPKSTESSQQNRKKKKHQRYRRNKQCKNQHHKLNTAQLSNHPAICTTHRWTWKTSKQKNFLRNKNGNFLKDTPFVLKLNRRKPLSSTFSPQPPQLDQKTTKAISPLPLSHPPSHHHRNPPMQSNLSRKNFNTCIVNSIKLRKQNKPFVNNELNLSCKLATIKDITSDDALTILPLI